MPLKGQIITKKYALLVTTVEFSDYLTQVINFICVGDVKAFKGFDDINASKYVNLYVYM